MSSEKLTGHGGNDKDDFARLEAFVLVLYPQAPLDEIRRMGDQNRLDYESHRRCDEEVRASVGAHWSIAFQYRLMEEHKTRDALEYLAHSLLKRSAEAPSRLLKRGQQTSADGNQPHRLFGVDSATVHVSVPEPDKVEHDPCLACGDDAMSSQEVGPLGERDALIRLNAKWCV